MLVIMVLEYSFIDGNTKSYFYLTIPNDFASSECSFLAVYDNSRSKLRTKLQNSMNHPKKLGCRKKYFGAIYKK